MTTCNETDDDVFDTKKKNIIVPLCRLEIPNRDDYGVKSFLCGDIMHKIDKINYYNGNVRISRLQRLHDRWTRPIFVVITFYICLFCMMKIVFCLSDSVESHTPLPLVVLALSLCCLLFMIGLCRFVEDEVDKQVQQLEMICVLSHPDLRHIEKV